MAVEADDLGHRAGADFLADSSELGAMHRDRVLEGGHFPIGPLLVGIPGLCLLPLEQMSAREMAVDSGLTYLLQAHRRLHRDCEQVAALEPRVSEAFRNLRQPVYVGFNLHIARQRGLVCFDWETMVSGRHSPAKTQACALTRFD